MAIDFYISKDGSGTRLAALSEHAVNALNEACQKHGADVFIDTYADTKLLAAHIARVLSLPEGTVEPDIRAAFQAMSGLEVVYAVGD